MKFIGGAVITAPTSLNFTESDAEWMRRMGFSEQQIQEEKDRRERLKTTFPRS